MKTNPLKRYKSLLRILSSAKIGLLMLFALSCSDGEVYMNSLDNHWEQNKAQAFHFEINDYQSPKNIIFVVRNNNEYPYSNIRFFSVLKEEGNKTAKVDTLNYILAKPNGEWLGKGFGNTKEILFQYKNAYTFPKNGKYSIEIKQAMRTPNLKGIEDIGVQIVSVK